MAAAVVLGGAGTAALPAAAAEATGPTRSATQTSAEGQPAPTSSTGDSAGDYSAGDYSAGDYVVTIAESASDAAAAAARQRAVARGAIVFYDYDTALRGFAAWLPPEALAQLVADPAIAAVEADRTVTVSAAARPSAGLDRIDQREPALDGTFSPIGSGKGVRIYVIDTGVMSSHDEFGGRVRTGKSFRSGPARSDCGEGHGTHVASVIAGERFGVARRATIVPVKVFGCDGSAAVSRVIAGVEWVSEHHRARGGPAVVNLSAGVHRSLGAGLERAVRGAIAGGLTFVTAAGNEGVDACRQSPGRMPEAITVGAVDGTDRRASFSNYGRCVDIFAPGVAVRAAGIASSSATAVKDGTSMAAPYVAGVVAAYLQRMPAASPAQVAKVLRTSSTSGMLRSLGSGSPNRLLYSRLPTTNQAPVVTDLRVRLAGRGAEVRRTRVPLTIRWNSADADGAVAGHRLQVSDDGGRSWSPVAMTNARARQARLYVRPSSNLRFRVRAVDDRDQSGPFALTPAVQLKFRQEGRADYGARWKVVADPTFSRGEARLTGKRGATAIFRFTGRSVAWIGDRARNYGRAKVFLDGRYLGTVDSFARSGRASGVLFTVGAGAGRHTLKIVVAGAGAAGSTGTRVPVDGFLVLG